MCHTHKKGSNLLVQLGNVCVEPCVSSTSYKQHFRNSGM